MVKFRAKKDEMVEKWVKEGVLSEVGAIYGSPVNILVPEKMDGNVREFREVIDRFEVGGKIFYAHKCNKSEALVRRAKYLGIGLDVASVEELKQGLGCGFRGEEMEITGPKNEELIRLGVMQGVMFNVDNLEELEQIEKMAERLGVAKVKVLLRFSDFENPRKKVALKYSRFGVTMAKVEEAIAKILECRRVDFLGVAFHLDTVEIEEKIVAVEQILKLFLRCFEAGLRPRVLNIGGGFKISYLESKEGWEEGISEMKKLIMEGKEIAWEGGRFGLDLREGRLVGRMNIYEHYNEEVKGKYLERILEAELEDFDGQKIGKILMENGIELYLEPGRSLLDGVGLTLARVNFVKELGGGRKMVGVDMNRSNLNLGGQEFLVDPILIGGEEEVGDLGDVGGGEEYFVGAGKEEYFVGGNLCMENDLIFQRKIRFSRRPRVGDWLVFLNTAGYLMDFSESRPIMQKVGEKVVLDERGRAYPDNKYNPWRKK